MFCLEDLEVVQVALVHCLQFDAVSPHALTGFLLAKTWWTAPADFDVRGCGVLSRAEEASVPFLSYTVPASQDVRVVKKPK